MSSKSKSKTKIKPKKVGRCKYSSEALEQALLAVNNGSSLFSASKTFGIPRTTLYDKLHGFSPVNKIMRGGYHSQLGLDVENEIVDWLIHTIKLGFPINKECLFTSAQKLTTNSERKNTFANGRPGRKWYYSFLTRHKELDQKNSECRMKSKQCVTEMIIRNWFKETKINLGKDFETLNDPRRIFHMDETDFHLSPAICKKKYIVKNKSSKSIDESITALFAVSANGGFAPPLILYKNSQLPASIKCRGPKNWSIVKTESGCMTSELFFEYVTNVFHPFLTENAIRRPVVIFMDGFRSHLSYELGKFCTMHKIIFLAFQPNSTHILQPLNVSTYEPMKNNWKSMVQQWHDEKDSAMTNAYISGVLSQIVNDPKTNINIQSGFKATGIYPFNPDAVDYSKMITGSQPLPDMGSDQKNAYNFLMFVEQNIEANRLMEFKKTKSDNRQWEGEIESLHLYEFWLKITNKYETQFPTSSELDTIENNIPVPDIKEETPLIIGDLEEILGV